MGRNWKGNLKQWDQLGETHIKPVLSLRALFCSYYMVDSVQAKSDWLIWWGIREEFRATKNIKKLRRETPRKETQKGGAPNSAYKYQWNLDWILIWIHTGQE